MILVFALISLAATALTGLLARLEFPGAFWQLPLLFLGFLVALKLLWVLMLVVVSLFLPMNKVPEKRNPFIHWLVVCTLGLLTGIFRVRVHMEGEEKLPTGSRWLMICNHRSAFDPLFTVWALRRREIAFVAKQGVFRIPVAGRVIYRDFYLAIDREDNREALKTILRAASYVKNDLTSMVIYPEGTRTRDGKLLPFRNGALKIAQRAGCPIVVAVVEGSEKIMHRFPLRSTPVTLKILTVFDAETVSAHTTAELGDRARDLMLMELGE